MKASHPFAAEQTPKLRLAEAQGVAPPRYQAEFNLSADRPQSTGFTGGRLAPMLFT
jgi:hypothetical protein